MIKMIYSCVQLYQQREFLSKRRIMVSPVYVHHLTIREGLSTLSVRLSVLGQRGFIGSSL
jgi:hypothetical protein